MKIPLLLLSLSQTAFWSCTTTSASTPVSVAAADAKLEIFGLGRGEDAGFLLEGNENKTTGERKPVPRDLKAVCGDGKTYNLTLMREQKENMDATQGRAFAGEIRDHAGHFFHSKSMTFPIGLAECVYLRGDLTKVKMLLKFEKEVKNDFCDKELAGPNREFFPPGSLPINCGVRNAKDDTLFVSGSYVAENSCVGLSKLRFQGKWLTIREMKGTLLNAVRTGVVDTAKTDANRCEWESGSGKYTEANWVDPTALAGKIHLIFSYEDKIIALIEKCSTDTCTISAGTLESQDWELVRNTAPF